MHSVTELNPLLRKLHCQIRDEVLAKCERTALDDLSRIDHDSLGDTIYAVDRVSEEVLVSFFEREIAPHVPVVLIAEGLPGNGQITLPYGVPEADAEWRIIIDPIDGTRGLMYQKRSAWILTGVAPNKGPDTCLQDIVFALQTEIPLVKQYLTDQLWAEAGGGVQAERLNRLTGQTFPLHLKPSRAITIAHGFATVARFFPGAKVELSAIDESITTGVLGPVQKGKAHSFEDQYISTGGQLYELMNGHDRFIADLRPLMEPLLAEKGLSLGLCCHPYDMCTELIARQLGVVITAPDGTALKNSLNVTDPVAWVGYANEAIRAEVEPWLKVALRDTIYYEY
ncbi:MAG: inositol monophosphatase [Anaerolineales bacterium]|nr:MAG: inositol monophosphatase [Anaerolineales bacterium]